MIEAVQIWNEPNHPPYWDESQDPEWREFAQMAGYGAQAIRETAPHLPVLLPGLNPTDSEVLARWKELGLLERFDAVAAHGFPMDWSLWQINDWPRQIAAVRAVMGLPLWITETGASTFGADEAQVIALRRTAQVLRERGADVERVYWSSLLDLPPTWEPNSRHRESEGSAYYRNFYLGLLRADRTPKPALEVFREYLPEMGISQWFYFEDPRLDFAVEWLHRLGVRRVRTVISWADWYRPNALAWFDRQMTALAPFDTTIVFCFTPPSYGRTAHHTSPPRYPERFGAFASEVIRRYVLEQDERGGSAGTAELGAVPAPPPLVEGSAPREVVTRW